MALLEPCLPHGPTGGIQGTARVHPLLPLAPASALIPTGLLHSPPARLGLRGRLHGTVFTRKTGLWFPWLLKNYVQRTTALPSINPSQNLTFF